MPETRRPRQHAPSTAMLLATLIAATGGAHAAPSDSAAALTEAAWTLTGEAHFEEHLGRRAIALRTGRAVAREIAFENGTVDFSIAFSGRRSFAYIDFRAAGDAEHEEIYFRPQKSRLPDALQYAPVFNGESEWQLYHGPGATAAVELPPGRWLKARLVVSGGRAALWVEDLSRPALVVPRLARGAGGRGPIGFRAFSTNDVPPGGTAAWISEVTVRTAPPAIDLAGLAPAEDPAPPGSLLQLDASAPFATDGALPAPPAPFVKARRLSADARGRFEPYRDFAPPDRDRAVGIWLRLPVRAETGGVRLLHLGFSDAVTVFLDGRPLASADARYSFDAPRQEGLMTLSQLTVFLPLPPGDHELLFGLVDGFGGMGLVARFADGAGLTLGGRD